MDDLLLRVTAVLLIPLTIVAGYYMLHASNRRDRIQCSFLAVGFFVLGAPFWASWAIWTAAHLVNTSTMKQVFTGLLITPMWAALFAITTHERWARIGFIVIGALDVLSLAVLINHDPDLPRRSLGLPFL